jgi:superfamily II DNA or RNA helicase
VKYRYKTTPYKHQVKALRKVVRRRGGALFMPMRSGKTKVAIDWTCVMYLKFHRLSGRPMRVLVVCPLSVKGVWKNQIRLHMPDEFKGHIKWKIINYERAYGRKQYPDGWEPVPRRALYKWHPDIIIVDEAHKIGNPATVQSTHIYKLQKEVQPRKLVLTGTPFHRKPLMVFGVFKFLDDQTFGVAHGTFKKRYAKWGGYGYHRIVKLQRQNELVRKMAPLTFLMKTMPYVPPQHEVVPFHLKESEAAYESMAREAIAVFKNGGVLEAPIALTKTLRLAQICGGRVRDSDGEMQRIGREKRKCLEGLVDQFVDSEVQKFVCYARFVPELKDIVEVCRNAGYTVYLMYGKTPGDVREQRIAEFDETKDKAAFVSQVSTGSMGIDLSAASVEVFYSLPQSLVDYDQDCARIRKFRDHRTLTYYYLCAEGTIEEVNLSALRANLELIDVLERDPQLLSYEARG